MMMERPANTPLTVTSRLGNSYNSQPEASLASLQPPLSVSVAYTFTITTQAMIGYSDSDPKFAAAAVKSRVESFGVSKTFLQTLKAEFFARECAKSIG